MSVRVLIVDDQEPFRDVAREVVEAAGDFTVVGEAQTGEESVELARELQPDLVLMDISMPVLDGFEATERIRAELPEVCVLMVTGSAADADIRRSREAGASGYVTKDRIAEELVRSIRDVAASC